MGTKPALDESSKHLLSSHQEPLSSLPSWEHTAKEPFNYQTDVLPPHFHQAPQSESCFCEHALHHQRSWFGRAAHIKWIPLRAVIVEEEKQDHCFQKEHWFKKRWRTAPKRRWNIPPEGAIWQHRADSVWQWLPKLSTSDPILQHQDQEHFCHIPSVQPKKTTRGTELPKNWLEKTDSGWAPLTGRDTQPHGHSTHRTLEEFNTNYHTQEY